MAGVVFVAQQIRGIERGDVNDRGRLVLRTHQTREITHDGASAEAETGRLLFWAHHGPAAGPALT